MEALLNMDAMGPGSSRTDAVHRFLLDAISSGDYAAGSRLPSEIALAAQLGVSRPVIREATSRLAAAGAVRTERGRGTFVSDQPVSRHLSLSPIEDVRDMIAWQDFRIAIEQECARLAAIRHGPEQLADIEAVHLRMVDLTRSGERSVELDFEFHLAVARATQNAVLVRAQQSLGDHIRNWMMTILKTAPSHQSDRHEFRNREHLAIMDAIQRRDPDAASQAARRHIENGRTRLLTTITMAGQDAMSGGASVRRSSPKSSQR